MLLVDAVQGVENLPESPAFVYVYLGDTSSRCLLVEDGQVVAGLLHDLYYAVEVDLVLSVG